MQHLFEAPVKTIIRSHTLTYDDSVHVLQRLSPLLVDTQNPIAFANRPFEQYPLTLKVFIGYDPAAPVEPPYTIQLHFSIDTPFGASFVFNSPTFTCSKHNLAEFGYAQIYRFLGYLDLFQQVANFCQQHHLPLECTTCVPDLRSARIFRAGGPSGEFDLVCRWAIPDLFNLEWHQGTFSMGADFLDHLGSTIKNPALFLPTLGIYKLLPPASASPSLTDYFHHKRPYFFYLMSAHIDAQNVLKLTC